MAPRARRRTRLGIVQRDPRRVLAIIHCHGPDRAALRAVAEQLVPQMYVPERFYSGEDFEEYARQMTRQHLLAIADELEG